MPDIDLSLTGTQIDSALTSVHNPDPTPTSSSTKMVTSGGVHAALNDIQFANLNSNLVSTDLSSGNNNTTIPTTQAVADLISSGSNTVHICTASSGQSSTSTTHYRTGWNTNGSSAVTTSSQGLTISGAGVWLCSVSAVITTSDDSEDYQDFTFTVLIGGGTYNTIISTRGEHYSLACSFPFVSTGSFDFKLKASKNSGGDGSGGWRPNSVATFYKLA